MSIYIDENIATIIIPLLREYNLIKRLRFFISNNLLTNDIAIRCILKELLPSIKNPDSRRIKCRGHIINLAAKAFLFGNNDGSFEAVSRLKKEQQDFKAVRKLWRIKGPFRKFHNIVLFIRKTP